MSSSYSSGTETQTVSQTLGLLKSAVDGHPNHLRPHGQPKGWMVNQDSWKRGGRLKTGEKITRERDWKGGQRKKGWGLGYGSGARGIKPR